MGEDSVYSIVVNKREKKNMGDVRRLLVRLEKKVVASTPHSECGVAGEKKKRKNVRCRFSLNYSEPRIRGKKEGKKTASGRSPR